MPINNSTYSRGTQAKTRGKADRAQKDKARFCQTKFSIRFSRDSLTIEHISKKG